MVLCYTIYMKQAGTIPIGKKGAQRRKEWLYGKEG